MGAPAEPLLPPEEPRRFPLKLWLLVGGAAVALGGVVTIALRLPSSPPPEEAAAAPSPERAPAAAPSGGARKEAADRARQKESEEKAAQQLYASAEAFERATPGDPEKVMPRYLEVYQKHPTTGWGKKAEQRVRAIDQAFQASLEREFQGVKKDSQALAGAGHFTDAIETVADYLKEQTRDALRQRAGREIAALENASREAFNRLAQQASGTAKRGGYAEAAELFVKLKEGAIPEVAARCDAAIAELREAAKAFDASASSKQNEEAHKAFREGPATQVLALLRARRYDEGLKEFDAAPAGLPDLAAERGAIVQAAAFWEAFLKTLRSKVNADVTIALAGPKELRVSGKLVRLGADRAALDTGDATAEALFEKVHVDQIVAWTIGRSLPAEDAATYVKAALFFFCDGHDDLARLYLATAKEMGADITEPERVFREGLLRAASRVKK